MTPGSPDRPVASDEGALLASKRYELVELLGTGGMANVWKARDTVLDRWVAVKRLLPHAITEPDVAARFRREALSAARLSHPGIVTVFDTGEDEDGPFIVLELVEGETLAALVRRAGPLDLATTAGMVRQIGDALDYAHERGVIHRDVKPANLIASSDGTVQLADFGIARAADDATTITEPGAVIGTLSYLAPEVIEGGEITRAADIYSLGAVTFEMLTGAPPFQADNIGALLGLIRSGDFPGMPGVPDAVADAVARSMSADPADRPATAGEFAGSLLAGTTLSMPAVTATPPPIPESAGTVAEDPTLVLASTGGGAEPRKPRGRAGLIAALVIAGLAVTAFALMTGEGDPQAVAATTTTLPAPDTTTSVPTTTSTTPTTTTTVPTPESVADEIEAHLVELTPPDFRPKDVKRVENALAAVMDAWAAGDEEEIANELEAMGEAILQLPETEATNHLMDHFVELAALMGFDVQSEGGEEDD